MQIIYDKVTNRSRGFAFVTMATAEEAAKAIQMFDGAVSTTPTNLISRPFSVHRIGVLLLPMNVQVCALTLT